MALILCIETTSQTCSVALAHQNQLLYHLENHEQNHAALLTTLIQQLLKHTQYQPKHLNAIAFSQGPGSYTSLRIGAATAKALCYALNIPLIATNTLQNLTQNLIYTSQIPNTPYTLYAPLIDARRMEVYTTLFDHQLNTLLPTQPLIITADAFQKYLTTPKHQIILFGNGAPKCQNILNTPPYRYYLNAHTTAPNMIPEAYHKYTQKIFENTAYYEPFYLKPFFTTATNS